MEKTKLSKTGIYMRVSTAEQAKDGFSINAQKEKLTSYAMACDWSIIDYYVDEGISGKNITERISIRRLIDDVKSGKVNNVLIYKLDRLTRSVKDLITLIELFEKHDCSFNSVTERLDTSTATGRMFIKIIGIFAEFERENLAERVSFGYEEKTREGNYTNTNGVNGYDYIIGKGDLIVNETEKELVNRVFDLYLDGTSMLKIARTLNTEKIPSKRGGYWSQSTIKSILTNPLYVGKIRYGVNKKNKAKSFAVDGQQEIIVDTAKFDRVQELITKRKKFNIKKYPSENAYFSSVLKCSKCGAKCHPKQQRQNGKYYITYYCNNIQTAKCNSQGISHLKVLQAFEEYISDYKFDKKLLPTDNKKDQIVIKDKLLKNLQAVDEKRKRIQFLFIEEQISNVEYHDMLNSLEQNRLSILDSLNELTVNKELEIDLDTIKDILHNFKENWDFLNTTERNSFINQFINNISIDVDNRQVKIQEINFV